MSRDGEYQEARKEGRRSKTEVWWQQGSLKNWLVKGKTFKDCLYVDIEKLEEDLEFIEE